MRLKTRQKSNWLADFSTLSFGFFLPCFQFFVFFFGGVLSREVRKKDGTSFAFEISSHCQQCREGRKSKKFDGAVCGSENVVNDNNKSNDWAGRDWNKTLRLWRCSGWQCFLLLCLVVAYSFSLFHTPCNDDAFVRFCMNVIGFTIRLRLMLCVCDMTEEDVVSCFSAIQHVQHDIESFLSFYPLLFIHTHSTWSISISWYFFCLPLTHGGTFAKFWQLILCQHSTSAFSFFHKIFFDFFQAWFWVLLLLMSWMIVTRLSKPYCFRRYFFDCFEIEKFLVIILQEFLRYFKIFWSFKYQLNMLHRSRWDFKGSSKGRDWERHRIIYVGFLDAYETRMRSYKPRSSPTNVPVIESNMKHVLTHTNITNTRQDGGNKFDRPVIWTEFQLKLYEIFDFTCTGFQHVLCNNCALCFDLLEEAINFFRHETTHRSILTTVCSLLCQRATLTKFNGWKRILIRVLIKVCASKSMSRLEFRFIPRLE